MKHIFFVLCIFFLGKFLSQDPIFFNNQQNRIYLNPAHTGLVESFRLVLIIEINGQNFLEIIKH